MATALPSIYQQVIDQAGKTPGVNQQDLAQASNQFKVEQIPQENTLNYTLQQLQGASDRDINSQAKYGDLADKRIGDVGTQLQQTLQGNVGKIGDIYSQGQQSVGSAYDQANQVLQSAGQSIQSNLGDTASRLGLGEALKSRSQFDLNPQARLQSNLDIMTGRNASAKAAGTANLATLGTQLSAIAQKAVGDSAQNTAQKRQDTATQVLKTIGDIQTKTNESTQGILQKYHDLASVAGAKFSNLLTAATSSRNAVERQNSLDALKVQMDMANLQLKQQSNDIAASKAARTNDPNSLTNQKTQLEIDKLKSDKDKTTYISDSQGNSQLMDYLNQSRGGGALTGTQYAGIQNFINKNAGAASALNTDPYKYLTMLAQQQSVSGKDGLINLPMTSGTTYKQKNYTVPLQVLLDALTARYQNVGTAAKIGKKI